MLATFKNLHAERVPSAASPDILPIYLFGSKKLSAVMLSVQRLVEDWLLDIVLWYELKRQKVIVKGDAGN